MVSILLAISTSLYTFSLFHPRFLFFSHSIFLLLSLSHTHNLSLSVTISVHAVGPHVSWQAVLVLSPLTHTHKPGFLSPTVIGPRLSSGGLPGCACVSSRSRVTPPPVTQHPSEGPVCPPPTLTHTHTPELLQTDNMGVELPV